MKYSPFARFVADRRANAAIIFALAAVPILGLAGAALDYSKAASIRTELQATLDAALLNGAKAAVNTRAAAATTAFDALWQKPFGIIATATSSETSSTMLMGTATASVPTTVAGIIGFRSIPVSARGTVNIPAGNPPCMMILDPTAAQALLVNSGATVQAPNCEIHVKSKGNPAAIFNSGSTINSKKLCIEGSNVTRNGGSYSNLSLACATASDPYAGTVPTPSASSCTYSNLNYNGGNVTLQPGTYCGWFNFNSAPNIAFSPGLYVIKSGGWNVNGGVWNGTGVTFYFADTSVIQFNSGVKATLSAPTSGAWANFLFTEAPNLSKTSFILNDSNGQNFSGVIYLPTKNMTVNSASNVSTEHFSMVVNTLIFNSVTWSLDGSTSSSSSGSAPVLTQ